MKEKYNVKNLAGLIKDPRKIKSALGYLRGDIQNVAHNFLGRYHYSRHYKQDEEDIINKDWDNLILLDACRYDVLQSIWDDDIEKVVSVAGRSSGFIEETMNGKEIHDTVYVSSNPHIEKTLNDGVFHDIIKTYGDSWEDKRENDHTKFHPDNVKNIANEVIEKYENKRVIVHFMQPHGPYFGDRAKELRNKLVKENNIKFTRLSGKSDDYDDQYADLMYAAKDGHISKEELNEVYSENLNIVLDYAIELSEDLEGKTVISADHGEKLGNPGGLFSPKYGHNGYAPEVRFVPWLELEHNTRKKVVREQPVESEVIDENTVSEQLEHLGYL